MDNWRFLKFQVFPAAMNMAIDEAVLRALMENRVPNTLRLYGWKPSAVSIGRFQKMEDEANMDQCRVGGVDTVRRISGGGTVYHDNTREITYCIVTKTKDLGSIDVAHVYTQVYSGIVNALSSLGITADFSEGDIKNCPNLTVKGKKISGSSQANRGGYTLQHGTLLVDVDLEKMFTFLRVPWAKTRMEVVEVARNRITSIRNELGNAISQEKMILALREGFERALGIKLVESELTLFEREVAEKLCNEKYSTDEWNLIGKSALC